MGCPARNSRRAASTVSGLRSCGLVRRPASKSGGGSARKQRASSGVAQARVALAQDDEVEQVAVLARGGVTPAARGRLARRRSGQVDIEAAARLVVDVADYPVMA